MPLATIGTDIQKAANLLREGELVAIPTETVYGLAGNALDTQAVTKIFEAKNRPSFNPLIVHCANLEVVDRYVEHIPLMARKAAAHFWPGPLTILLPKKPIIHDLVTAGSELVAIRIPSHPLTNSLLEEIDSPVAAPSANPFGYISPTNAHHVADQLGDKIKYILDGGNTLVGIESTIIGFDEQGRGVVYRHGGISKEALEEVLGPVCSVKLKGKKPDAPGMLKSHYAPQTSFVLGDLDELLPKFPHTKIGVISFGRLISTIPANQQVMLSPKGSMAEAARNLFAAMRKLDSLKLQTIIAEPLPEEGLGRAINDRLRRAAADKN
ncbi:MAG: L-threonylcarbamoyladenylate synthase [Bacteroidota bacterium]